jgi:hypothetical protein
MTEEEAIARIRALSPEAVARGLAERRVTHCEHGKPRAQHCPWCYVQTWEYKQSVFELMNKPVP